MTLLERIQYRIFWGSCRVIGLLPDGVLYRMLGGVIYVTLYYMVRYRVRVVRENLANSFPEKTERERKMIEKKFYHQLSEIFIDTIKLASISKTSILSRMTYRNVEQHEAALKNRSWISAMSHFGSWELTVNYVLHSDHRLLAVYRPLHNKVFEQFYRDARSRFGTEPIPMNDILREVVYSNRPGNQKVAVAMISDQTPPRHEIKHWYSFLNQDTPFFSGFEKMAKRFEMPVFFLYVRKTGKRSYEGVFEMIYDGTEDVSDHEITQRYVTRLEAMIRETPELWTWSHRRWKHTRESVAALRQQSALSQSKANPS